MHPISGTSSSKLIEDKNLESNDRATKRMMTGMGYISGTTNQGITQPVEVAVQFGLKLASLEASNETWDADLEVVHVPEELEWIENKKAFEEENLHPWIVHGPKKSNIDDEIQFCDQTLLKNVLKAKDIFNELNLIELCKARARANPFESIRSAFFMNRAALKMANIDASNGFMFTDIDRNTHHRRKVGPYYFADVCAGPGGFSEYVLWRKKWLFKGFGFTLRGEHDFKLNQSNCASGVTFQPLYGAFDNGDIRIPDNIDHFSKNVLHETEDLGVHFMMSDGGFSVEGIENLQEILSKQIYACQCLMALKIVRPNGHFVTKLFDTFTPFSVGLLYLMYKCFERVTIMKPNSSRPANSERYLICYGLKSNAGTFNIRKYLSRIVNELWELQKLQNNTDLIEIVPLYILKNDQNFYNYIVKRNNEIGQHQTEALIKLGVFCRNPSLIERKQELLRNQCLQCWRIPDNPKAPLPSFTVDDLLTAAVHNPEFMFVQPREIYEIEELNQILNENQKWHYIPLASDKTIHACNIYAGVANSRVYKLEKNKWVRVKNIHLVRGTLLYGEMLAENVIKDSEPKTEHYKKSLHVVDALRLGDTSLADLSFKERLDLIETYCEAINHESRANKIRIRIKLIRPLRSISSTSIIQQDHDRYFLNLPTLGPRSLKEFYEVNSLLLLKTDESQSYHSTYISRIQIYLKKDDCDKTSVDLKYLADCTKS